MVFMVLALIGILAFVQKISGVRLMLGRRVVVNKQTGERTYIGKRGFWTERTKS